MVYNRPRPLDDAYPEHLAGLWGLDYYGTALVEAGGNMLLDGQGAVLVSDIIFDPSQGFDPNLTQAQLEQYFLEYFGVHKVIVTPHLQYDGTGHIDMFVKLLNDTTVIVGEYETPSAGAGDNYNICNQVATQLANETNGAGQPFQVVRMLMPPYSGGVTYTYINSFIANKKVYVPIYGFATDDSVLAQYADLLPGYEIIGFDCNQIIPTNGAIHCIAMKVPAFLEQVSCDDWALGDVNSDGQLDLFDVLLVVEIVLDDNFAGTCARQAADLNTDGEVSVLDMVQLVNIVLGF
jgi:agmatine/peptidylarginine deiminase